MYFYRRLDTYSELPNTHLKIIFHTHNIYPIPITSAFPLPSKCTTEVTLISKHNAREAKTDIHLVLSLRTAKWSVPRSNHLYIMKSSPGTPYIEGWAGPVIQHRGSEETN
jgi:hypothetical protein